MPLKDWPHVVDEHATIRLIKEQGYSVSRFGDGEAKMAYGAEYVREPRNDVLAAELRAILDHPFPRCLVGIPTLDQRSPKIANWRRRVPQFLPLLSSDVRYVSAFISRPDSSPWILTQEYAEAVQALWQGRKVSLVAEPTNKLATVVPRTVRKFVLIPCPHREAYAQIGVLEKAALHGAPDVVLLSCGPTATCLAHRLACRGVQALDLGSIGGMLLRLLPSERLPTTYPVAVSHPHCQNTNDVQAYLEEAGFTVHYNGEKG